MGFWYYFWWMIIGMAYGSMYNDYGWWGVVLYTLFIAICYLVGDAFRYIFKKGKYAPTNSE